LAGELPATRVKPTWTPAQVATLRAAHSAPGFVALADFWVVPLSAECVLILARAILWRRHGYLCGLLVGCAATAWSHGRPVLDVAAVVAHLAGWWEGGGWPGGGAPILLLTASAGQVAEVQTQLAHVPQAARARLRHGPSLSEQHATSGLKVAGFVAAPTLPAWRAVPIVRRCAEACALAGLPDGQVRTLDEPGQRGGAFRAGLFPAGA